MTKIPVSGATLEWARTERHLSVEDAAHRLGVSTSDLLDLESERTEPTIGALRKMASKYEIAFASLLMPTPLPAATRPQVNDNRTLRGERPDLTLDLQRAIEDVWDFVDDLADLRLQEPDLFPDADTLPVVNLGDDAQGVAARERSRLGFSIDEQIGFATDREAFLRCRVLIENQGVFVHLKNLGHKDNCRGFAINDERRIPFIFLNSDTSGYLDDYRSLLFGLLHEYCHVLMRQNAMSDHRRSAGIEGLCNRFAAFFLMPEDRFRHEYAALGATSATVREWHVTKLSRRFHVSMSAVAIHLETLRLAPSGFYDRLHDEWRKRKVRDGQGRAPHEAKIANRFGVRYLKVVLDAKDRGALNKIDLYEMTGIKPRYIEAVRDEVSARLAAYGR